MNNFDIVLKGAFEGFEESPWHLDCIQVMAYLDGLDYNRSHESELRLVVGDKKLLILEQLDHKQLTLIIHYSGEICTWQMAPQEFSFHRIEEIIKLMEQEIDIMLDIF